MGAANNRSKLGLMPVNRLDRFSHVCDLVLKARLTPEEKKQFYNNGKIKWGIIGGNYVKDK